MNDNLFKNALVVLIAFGDAQGGGAMVAIAGGLFISPYLIGSATAGEIADRFDKAALIRVAKLFELGLMLAAAAGLLTGSAGLMLAVLFGLGVQATFFGPLKYGILPELLAPGDLLRGNALIEAGTFASILVGTIAGGALIGAAHGPEWVGGVGIAAALAGIAAAWTIPRGQPASPGLVLTRNPLTATRRLLATARSNRSIWSALLGLSVFWAIGATYLAQFPVLAKVEFAADNRVVTLLLASFTVGVGLGSLSAGRLARVRHLVPIACVLLTLSTWAFVALAAQEAASGWHTPADMVRSPDGLGALLCLLLAAAGGGAFSVPLYATLQRRAAPAERARMIAANNVMNAAFMVAAALAVAGLAAAGLRPGPILILAGALNLCCLLAAGCRGRVAEP